MISTTSRPFDRLKDLARAVRRLPARFLHPWRRKRARRLLSGNAPPLSVLVVCHGNICRSPYAAAKLRALLPSGLPARVDSAGFIGPHREAPPDAVAVAELRGVDLKRHRSRVLTPESVRGAELVVVMEPRQAGELQRRYGRTRRPVLILGDLDPEPGTTRTIRDPVDQPRAVFANSYQRIDRCLDEMVKAVWQPQ